MNIQTQILDRVNARLEETKNPCKSYKTEASAEKATLKMAEEAAEYFGAPKTAARYFTVYVPKMDRWIGAIDLSHIISQGKHGGYLGICTGFYTY